MRPALVLPLLGLAAGAALAAGEHRHGHAHDHDHAHARSDRDPAKADAPRREMGAHVHGQGALDIAVEGDGMVMAFAAPGADIVGFEHPAASDADRAAIEAAKARLADPLALFGPSEAAGCAATSATVALDGDDHGHGHAHGHDHAGARHTEFRAEYALTCAAIDRLQGFDFGYFAMFPNAERLDVTIVSDRGQRAFVVERGAPAIGLDGGA